MLIKFIQKVLGISALRKEHDNLKTEYDKLLAAYKASIKSATIINRHFNWKLSQQKKEINALTSTVQSLKKTTTENLK